MSITTMPAEWPASASVAASVLDCLSVLDARLARAVDAAGGSFGTEPGLDPFRGLHLGATDVVRLFNRGPGSSPLGVAAVGDLPYCAPFAWLADEFGLSEFELNVVLITLAPEIDSRYERVYGFLQDDVTRRRPTVELALNLLCSTASEKLQARRCFAPDAPLRHEEILRLVPDPGHIQPPLLAHYLKVDDHIVEVLLGTSGPSRTATGAARATRELATLAEPVEPKASWQDLVLPGDAIAALREICGRVAGRDRVLGRWGFDAKLARGKGANALFTGPPGTGKTMAAEVVAAELHLDLFRIDLASVVSKYIGETEKNLARIFAVAERSGAVLLFDEAEALLGKRSDVHDAHDRYANIEVAYLLQRMEAYRGLALLSTNRRHHMDEAFARRLAFAVHFPFPDAASRLRIWRGIWPPETPLSGDADLGFLADRFKLSGGNIKNIALAAAFLAGNGPVSMAHLLHAVRREYQKLGKAVTEAELALDGGRDG